MGKSVKIALTNLGCPKNTIDSERMLGALAEKGGVICSKVEDAEVMIIATCSFIAEARDETARALGKAIALKIARKIRGVIIAGCIVEHYGENVCRILPGADAYVSFANYGKMHEIALMAAAGQSDILAVSPKPEKIGYEGARLRITPQHYAYLRIAEGCDNRCAYCSIPRIRGGRRSKPMSAIMREARELVRHGAKELILVAEDTTAWGIDLKGNKRLHHLIEALDGIKGIEWIRLMYAYPSRITRELAALFSRGGKLIPYLDLPIQHASDAVLKRMGRHYGEKELQSALDMLLDARPDMILRTSVITGFPGETPADHKKLAHFISRGYFKRLGTFIYSLENDTPAAKLTPQVPEREALLRQMEIMDTAGKVLKEHNASLVGKQVAAIIDCETAQTDYPFTGRTFGDAPEIDANVFIKADKAVHAGDIVECAVTGAEGYDLKGEVARRNLRGGEIFPCT
jgi:ribosomal protein S12 methylthiotransferase